MTPHNSAKKGEIEKKVIMAGDPLRVKFISENFLENPKLVSNVRGICCYSGTYKGEKISVMAHGMGIPSMGIYSYELFHFYDVSTVIRVGSCGALTDKLKLKDIILVENSYTESSYAYSFDNKECNMCEASLEINNIIENTAKEQNIILTKGTTLCNDCFDLYLPEKETIINRAPKDIELIASEMEAFALFYNAKREKSKAACLLSVSDAKNGSEELTAKERETSLESMIILALESIIKITK